jgi:hypothetical protein
MNEKKIKVIIITGMSLAAIVGSIYGLYITIFGYLTDSGPGGSMEGPLWKIMLTGSLTVLVGAYVGELVVRKLAKRMLLKQFNLLEYTLRSFAIVLLGSMAAFIISWEIGYLLGKITGTIEGLDWITVLIYTPLMSLIYGIPVSLGAAVLMGLFTFLYLKGGRSRGTPIILIIFTIVVSCTGNQKENEKIISSNPFLVGTWKGQGRFMDVSLNHEMVPIVFDFNINKDGSIKGKVGDANLTKTSIEKANYGFEIKGVLDSKINKDHELSRRHLIILLVLPEENRENASYSDANFHLKNNFFFDFAMRVGGVGLTKEKIYN